MDTPTFPAVEVIPPFPAYEVAGVGTVIAHEGANYIARTEDGRVIGFAAQSGTPSEANAAADFAWAAAQPQAVAVPASVTQRQLRLQLLAIGVTDAAVRAQLTGNESALIEWEYATEIKRTHPLVTGLGTALGLTSAQTDAVFIAAAQL